MASNFRMLDMLHMLTVGLNGSLLSSTPKLQMCNPYNGAESESVAKLIDEAEAISTSCSARRCCILLAEAAVFSTARGNWVRYRRQEHDSSSKRKRRERCFPDR